MVFRTRLAVIGFVALAHWSLLAAEPDRAHARPRWRGRPGLAVGALVAGVLIGASVHNHAPPFWVEHHTSPPPPPCCYGPPPPAQPYVHAHAAPPQSDSPRVGLALAGFVQAAAPGQVSLGGVAGALQFRTSSHSLLAVEVQSLGAYRVSDGSRRHDLAGLVAGRVFPWSASLAPYLELAGGVGRTALETSALRVRASHLLGRVALGLELRLGRHLVLDGQIGSVHRLRLDSSEASHAPPSFATHERATEVRGGVAMRF